MMLFTTAVKIALVAILIGIYLACPAPELDWEGMVFPLARKYAVSKGASTSTTSSNEQQQPLQGRIVVITGSTAGIGLGLTQAYTRLGATVVAVGRSQQKLEALQKDIPSILPVQADFADLEDVKKAAEKILDSVDRIDILINNAGTVDLTSGMFDNDYKTKQGYDHTFAVNYLSHFVLTEKLATLLQNGTIVQNSSTFHSMVNGKDLIPRTDQSPVASQPGGSHGFYLFRGARQYANSKFAQILHARALNKYNPLLENARVVSFCPGAVATKILLSSDPWIAKLHSRLHYSSDVNGYGLASGLLAALDTSSGGNDDYYISNPLFGLPPLLLPHAISDILPIRDVLFFAASVMVLQWKLVYGAMPASSSSETYDKDLIKGLYDWSLKEVSDYL